MTAGKYTINEVQGKVDTILGEKSFKVSNKFANVDNLMCDIEEAIKNYCNKHNLKYPPTFKQVLDYTEKALLSSKNWFNSEGLDFNSIRNCLNLRVELKKNYIPELDFFYNAKGSKSEKEVQIKELIAIAQAKRYKNYSLNQMPTNWHFSPTLRFENISYTDKSDAYQQEVIDVKCLASKPIVKGFSNNYMQETILMAIHYHSYVEDFDSNTKETGYYPTLEKFEIILVV